jgi:hypothetical protein
MGSRTTTWCDECRAVVTRDNHKQWAGCRANGWRYYDACSTRCAEAIIARVTAERASSAPGAGGR